MMRQHQRAKRVNTMTDKNHKTEATNTLNKLTRMTAEIKRIKDPIQQNIKIAEKIDEMFRFFTKTYQ